MKMLRCCALLLIGLALPGWTQAADWTVRFDGVGPLKFGMRFDMVNKLLGEHMERVPKEMRGSPNCFQVKPERQAGILLMFINDSLKRVDVLEPGILSERGIGLGDPVDKVKQIYGEAVAVTPRAYEVRELTLTIKAGGGQYAISFDTREGRIDALSAGAWREMQLIEGCL